MLQPPPSDKNERESLIHKCFPAIIGALIGALVTVGLFFASSTVTGHQRDHDVKQQLVESISTVASDATSYAEEVGSGEIVNEGTPSQPPSAVIQQRFDQARRDWRRGAELISLQIETYFPNPAKNELKNAWDNAEKMVSDLIFLSGQVDDRTPYVHDLQRAFVVADEVLTFKQWTVLGEAPGPGCYISGECRKGFQGDFLNIINQVSQDIQSYLSGLTAKIQNKDTIFQPWICAATPICNL